MWIVRYSEVGLKGKNRGRFEQQLERTMQACLKQNSIAVEKIERPYGRVLVYAEGDCSVLKRVFGIASFSEAIVAGSAMDEVKKKALEYFAISKEQKFRVSCQRLDKQYPLKSMEFEKELGTFVQEQTGAGVSMTAFDVNIMAEIIQGTVYFFKEKSKGLGGLPVGIEGTVLGLVEDETSLLACLLMMKRGCKVVPVALHAVDISLLQKFAYGYQLELLRAAKIEELDALAAQHNAKAVIVNDLLDTIREVPLKTQVLRPLSGFEKKEIEEQLNAYKAL